ncbi:MAG: hypothetical protein JWP44_3907 [Mucilaginibacter sp.]|nr:hypothetical protein [Mucilaginibacter sp.]
MKVSFPCFLITAALQLSAIGFCNAQSGKNTIGTLEAPPPHITIDGDSKEWGDSLRYYNPENRVNYSIANTKDTLYLAIRIKDRLDQTKVLRAGVTFGIDPKGKKKETYSITFPLNVQGSSPIADPHADNGGGEVTKEDREELMRQRITTLRGIKVTGFKDIESDMITTSNTYGFQTGVNYDSNGYLVCEAAIPLSFFHSDLNKNEWAFNFKINGFQHKAPVEGEQHEGGGGRGGRGGGGGMGGGRGGHGGQGGGGANHANPGGEAGNSELFKSSDFWEKYYLAK